MTKFLLQLLIPFVSFVDLCEVLERFGFVYKKSLVFRIPAKAVGEAFKWAEHIDYAHDGTPISFKLKPIKTGCFFNGEVKVWGKV